MLPALRRVISTYGPSRALRNPAWLLVLLLFAGAAEAAGPLRIVAFGDSLTQGYGLPEQDGLVPQLQRWVDARATVPVEVVNMGVSGDTTAGGLARMDWAMGEGADGVILELGANDMLRGIDPAETRANLDAMMGKLKARGVPVLLVGMQSAGNYGADYKARFDAIYPDLAGKYGALLDPFYFEGIADKPGMLQDDGLHPTAEGVAVAVDRLGPLVLELVDAVRAASSQKVSQ